MIVVVCLAVHVSSLNAQDTKTFQAMRFERRQAPGTFIRLVPPSTALSNVTLSWPSTSPTGGSQLLVASGTGPYPLIWQTPSGSILQVGGSQNMYFSGSAVESGVTANPGYYANDFMTSRTTSSQSATATQSTLMGGSRNEVQGYLGAMAGGRENEVDASEAVILGGSSNEADGYRAAMLGGRDNESSSNTSVVVSGEQNSNSSNLGVVGSGFSNSTSGNMAVIMGGYDHTNSSNLGAIGGGFQNTTSGNKAVVIGGASNSSTGNMSMIFAGRSSISSSNHTFIGGGQQNQSSGSQSVVLGGFQHQNGGEMSIVMGGDRNRTTTNYTTVGGGSRNEITSGEYGSILGGNQNTVQANYATISAGNNSTVTNQYSLSLGSRLTISGQNSVAWNAGTSAMSISTSNVAVIANATIYMANNSSNSSGVYFFERRSGSGAFTPAIANYVGIRGPADASSDVSNTLPDRIGTLNQVLSVSSVSLPNSTLAWAIAPSNPVVNAVAPNASPFALTAANLNSAMVRVDPTAAGANPKVITLANGDLSGRVVTIRCVSLTAGIRIQDADANIELSTATADLYANDTITLVWDGTSNVWYELGRSDK